MNESYSEADRLSFLKAVANLIGSDHKVTEDEKAQLNQLVMGLQLSPLDERIENDVIGEMDNPGDLTEILSSISSADLKGHLFRVLCEVAASDGTVADAERAKVKEAASVFGLDVAAATDLLDWTLASQKHEQHEQEILARLGAAS